MSSSIRTNFLNDEDSERLYRMHPHLKGSPDVYCPTCHKTGTYHWKGEDHPCDCVMQLQLYKHYLNAGIGKPYQRLTWADFTGSPEIAKRVWRYVDNHQANIDRGIGLLLTGAKGTGKTLVATLSLKDFVRFGYRCFSITFPQMIDTYTAGWYSDDERDYFQRKVICSEVLLVDDVGKERRNKTDLAQTTFDTVMRQRNQQGRPTFITSNLTLDQLEREYGGAVLSLMKERMSGEVFSGPDFRPTAQQREIDEMARGEQRPIA